MASTLLQRLNVACLNSGASPMPVAIRQPLAASNEASLSGCIFQKALAREGRMDARVNAAIGPFKGFSAVMAMLDPDQVPLQEYARSLTVQNSRDRSA